MFVLLDRSRGKEAVLFGSCAITNYYFLHIEEIMMAKETFFHIEYLIFISNPLPDVMLHCGVVESNPWYPTKLTWYGII